jgi:hypothetical protein
VTSATAHVRPDDVSVFARIRHRFRDWRHRRPFWGGLLAVLAGLPILYFPYAHLSIGGLTFAMATTGGAGSLIIGVLMIVLGISAWLQPASRIFSGVAAILLALVSIPVSNLGGFGMGLVPGLIGGGLIASWAPLKETAAEPGLPERAQGGAPGADESAYRAEPEPRPEPEQKPEPATGQAPTAQLPAQRTEPGVVPAAPGEPGAAGEAR